MVVIASTIVVSSSKFNGNISKITKIIITYFKKNYMCYTYVYKLCEQKIKREKCQLVDSGFFFSFEINFHFISINSEINDKCGYTL